MAQDLERLLLRVDADTSKARQELTVLENKVSDSSTKIGASYTRAGDAIQKLSVGIIAAGATAGAVAVAGGLAVLIKRAVEMADSIGDAAAGMGLSTDALQEYRFAAEQAGVQTQVLDGAIESFAKRVGEARSGTGELFTFLQKFDAALLQQIVHARDNDEALRILMRNLSGVENAADKAALSAAAFGSQAGAGMVRVAGDAADELDRMRQKAHELGAVMSSELIERAQQADDQFTLLARVFDTQLNSAILTLLPTVIKLTEEIIKALPSVAEFVERIALPFQSQSSMTLVNTLAHINKEISLLERSASSSAMTDNIQKMLGMTPGNEKRIAELRQQAMEIRQLLANRDTDAEIDPAGRKTTDPKIDLQADAKFVADMQKAVDRAAKQRERDRETALAFLARMQAEAMKAAEQEKELVRLTEQQNLAKLEKMLLSEEELARGRVDIHAAAEAEIANIDKDAADKRRQREETTARAFVQAWSHTASSINEGLGDVFEQNKNGFEVLRDIALSVFQDVGMAALRAAAASAGITGASSATNFGQLAVMGLGAVFGIQGFAGGGNPPLNRPSIVGENGPEIFIPRAAGTVMPIGAAGAPGVIVNTVVNVQGGAVGPGGMDAATLRQIEAQFDRIANNAFAAQMMNHMRPGGMLGPGGGLR